MILVDQEKYYKLTEPLQKVKINNLFARSVIEQHVQGKVYVDNEETPSAFYVVHPYGMSLLFGNSINSDFNKAFKDYALNVNSVRDKYEWMQAYDNDWNLVLAELFQDRLVKSTDNRNDNNDHVIELNTRINFKFNLAKYLAFKTSSNNSKLKIIRTHKQMFQEMKGSVIPYNFWDSADDFYEKGIGFSMFYKEKMASTAYSAFIHDNKLELGIETIQEFRGRGFAQQVCSMLIDYCIEYKLEPVWSCRLENEGSYRLAQKLGFEPTCKIPYYRLSI